MNIILNNYILDKFNLINEEFLVDKAFYDLKSGINEYRLYSITQEYINNNHKILGTPPICLHIKSLLGMPIDYEGLRIKRIKFDDKQEDLKNIFFKNQEIFCKKISFEELAFCFIKLSIKK